MRVPATNAERLLTPLVTSKAPFGVRPLILAAALLAACASCGPLLGGAPGSTVRTGDEAEIWAKTVSKAGRLDVAVASDGDINVAGELVSGCLPFDRQELIAAEKAVLLAVARAALKSGHPAFGLVTNVRADTREMPDSGCESGKRMARSVYAVYLPRSAVPEPVPAGWFITERAMRGDYDSAAPG